MTEQEFDKLPFKFVSHLALADIHIATYKNDGYGIYVWKYTRKKNEFEFGRSYTHFQYQGKVYKKKAKFLEAIKDL